MTALIAAAIFAAIGLRGALAWNERRNTRWANQTHQELP